MRRRHGSAAASASAAASMADEARGDYAVGALRSRAEPGLHRFKFRATYVKNPVIKRAATRVVYASTLFTNSTYLKELVGSVELRSM